jgi:DNA-directed RNA polymerase subunit RPC12/RpoP
MLDAKWKQWLEATDYAKETPKDPPTVYYPPPVIIYSSLPEELKSYPVPLPVPLYPQSNRDRGHPYMRPRSQSLPIFGYHQPIQFPFLSGFPPPLPPIAYRPGLMHSKSEQHLPDDIMDIIHDLEKPKILSNEETASNPELHKLTSQDDLFDERSDLELLEDDLDTDFTDAQNDDSGFAEHFTGMDQGIEFDPPVTPVSALTPCSVPDEETAILLFKTKLELQEQNQSKPLKTKLLAMSCPPRPRSRQKLYTCGKCGKEYQSSSGLKYHLEKAVARCNE